MCYTGATCQLCALYVSVSCTVRGELVVQFVRGSGGGWRMGGRGGLRCGYFAPGEVWVCGDGMGGGLGVGGFVSLILLVYVPLAVTGCSFRR